MLRTRLRVLVACLAMPICIALPACGEEVLGSPAAGSGGTGAAGQPPIVAGSSAAGGGAAGTTGAAGTGSGGGDTLHGYFNVTLKPALEETGSPPSTSFVGKLYAGPTPSALAFTKKMEAGGCTLSTPNVFFCEKPCTGAVCTADDTCTPYPAAETVGSVTLTGIGPNPVSMEPKANNYQPPAGTTLPYPPCAAGAEVKLMAAGGSHAPFTLSASCIEPLELADGVRIVKGQPLALTWNAGSASAKANVHVLLDISQHGTSRGNIQCDVPDTGSLSIPAAMVDALVELGISGFPTVVVTRESEGIAAAGGPSKVFLKLSSPYSRAVEIPGLVSCNQSSQCPAGQTCQADLKCE